MKTYSEAERKKLAKVIGCSLEDLNEKLEAYKEAAAEEYVQMILGQQVLTRGQDVREYRLFLMVTHVFGGRLPTEKQVSAHFRTTETQSRAMLRAIASKYQYELEDSIRKTMKEEFDKAIQIVESGNWRIKCNFNDVIEGLNREIIQTDGSLLRISKERGTAGAWLIPAATHDALKKALGSENDS